jgi:hypothetical protein
MFASFKNRDYLEECYEQFNHICERKNVQPDLVFKSTDEARKTGYFTNNEEEIEASYKEEKMQRTIFSELKGVKDASKRAILDWMNIKINEIDSKKEMTIPRLGLRHHRLMKG